MVLADALILAAIVSLLAATSLVETGGLLGGAGLLALLFRLYFRENNRNSAGTWQIVDELRVERDYHRARADHWQARAYSDPNPPPHPNPLDQMRAEARAQQEENSGRHRRIRG